MDWITEPARKTPVVANFQKEIFADTVVKPYAYKNMRLPYGSLLPQKVDNLLVAGRCLSAEEEILGAGASCDSFRYVRPAGRRLALRRRSFSITGNSLVSWT